MSNKINEELRKALDTSVATTGSVLINEHIDREMRGLIIADSPMLNRVTRRSWPTNAYKYRIRLTDPQAFFLNDGEDLPNSQHSTWDDDVVMMKYIYNRVEVTGPEQYAVREHIDIMADQLEAGARQMARKLEKTLLFGDSAVRPKEFDGIVKKITSNVLDLDTDATGTVAKGKLYLSHLDEALDRPHYMPNTIAGSRAFGRRVNALLQAQQRFVEHIDVDGGFNVASYRGVPIYALDNTYNPDAELGSTVLMFHNTQVRFLVQRETFVEKLAKTKDSDDYMIGMYCTVAVHDENVYHAKITNADFTVTNG